MKQQHNTYERRQGKQNIFMTVTAGRNSVLYSIAQDFIFALSSYPSYISEVFLRRNMGERYFSFSVAITITSIMLFPYFFKGSITRDILGLPWLIFALLFLYQSIRRRMEIKSFGFTYDFDRFSHTDGERLEFLDNLIGKRIFGIKITRYGVIVLFEPAIPILIGLFLILIPFTRAVGFLLLISGIFYCYRSIIKIYAARDYVLDKNDEQLIARWAHDIIMEEKPQNQTAGLHFPIDLPEDKNFRESLVGSIQRENSSDIWNDGITGIKPLSS